MCADNGTYVADNDLGNTQLLFKSVCKVFRVVKAVAVRNKHGLLFGLGGGTLCVVKKRVDCGFSSSRLGYVYELALEIMVPITAVAALTRPPLLRKKRSSTVNQ